VRKEKKEKDMHALLFSREQLFIVGALLRVEIYKQRFPVHY